MKFRVLYVVSVSLLLCITLATNAIAQQLIGKVVAINKNQNEIKVEVYKHSNGFSWARLLGFGNQNITKQLIIVRMSQRHNINKITLGNFVKLTGQFRSAKVFMVKQIEILPRDPTGVRERLGLIRHMKKLESHRTRPHMIHIRKGGAMRPHQGGRHR